MTKRYDNKLIKIEGLASLLEYFRPKIYHPDDPRYQKMWQLLRQRCIEGIWVEQFGKWRYMPGRLGFFGVFGRFEDWNEIDKTRVIRTPKVRDLEWHRAYYRLEMDGFSGWEDDDYFTSDEIIFEAKKDVRLNIPEKRYLQLFKPNGDFKEYIPRRENIFKLHEEPKGRPLYYNQAKNYTELGSRGGGKALLHGSKVYCDGYEKNIEDVLVGDQIYDHEGNLTTVTEVFPQGKVKILEITLRDGRKVKCCENHLWKVYDSRKHRYTIKKAKDLLQDYCKKRIDKRYNKYREECFYFIPNNKCLNYSTKDYELDPYMLGALLGDGCFRDTFNHSVFLTLAEEDMEIIVPQFDLPKGFRIAAYNDSGGNKHIRVVKTHLYSSHNGEIQILRHKLDCGREAIWHKLEKLGLAGLYSHEKFIPEEYFYGDENQRYRLLQGLMDTDGSVYGHHKEFASSSKKLAEGIVRLARSLGIACSIKEKKTTHKKAYRVLFYTDNEYLFFLPRKRDKIKKFTSNYAKSKSEKSAIVDIQYVGEGEATCIMVDNKEHLFLTDNFVVTHNSYWTALGELLPDLCFDGAKYYNPGDPIDTRAVLEVTSGGGGKSTELLEKVEFGMNCLAKPEYKELGVWGNPQDPDFEPCPFYKRMEGSLKSNNKENPWINEFQVKIGDHWKTYGTGSRVYNTIYSVNQRAGAQKSAGGRRTNVVHEEIGLNEELISAWGSNEGMIKDGGVKMASQKGIGTSGNMETIHGAKKIFTNPGQFDCLEFHYPEYGDNAFGWFLATWMIDTKFKDADGNTDEETAKEYHWNIYNDKKQNSLPEVFMEHRMNFPMKIEDMWVTTKGHRLPVTEAEEREKELMKNNLYQTIGQHIELYWDSEAPSGVSYKLDTEAQGFYEWPLAPDRKTLEPVFTMYIHPDKLKLNGVLPNDVVFVTYDPYISEEIEGGGSLGVAHFFVNPKYIPQGLPGNCLAATLIGKSSLGTAHFHEILEMGMAFYGNPIHGLWYEANRGDKVRADFIKHKKGNLLCLRPQFEQGQFLYARRPTQTGYIVGNKIAKIALLDSIRDILLEETELTINNETTLKRNIERFPCIFTLRQIKQYRIDGNFDAVSSLQGWPLAVGEQEHRILAKSSAGNPFAKANSKLRRRYERVY